MNFRQVWCVAYDDPTPHMDGVKRIRTGEWASEEEAEAALDVVRHRSHAAPKRNLKVETRWVSDWTLPESSAQGRKESES